MSKAKREGFTFFKSFIEAVEDVYDDRSIQDVFIAKIVRYGIYEEYPVFENKIDNALFKLIKPNIDSRIRQYDQKKYARDKKEEKRLKRESSEEFQNSENKVQNSENKVQNSENDSQSFYSNTNTTSISISSNTSTSNKNSVAKKKPGKDILYQQLPSVLAEALEDFEKMRKQIKAPVSDKAREMILKKLHEYSNGDLNTMIDILNQSIVNCWKDIYPLKEIRQEKTALSISDMQAMKGTILNDRTRNS